MTVKPLTPDVSGKLASFVLLSWLYALYSFDYKWSLTNMPLTQRIAFFENHWAFFNGARPWEHADA